MAELNWSDAQWQKVNNCVTEAFCEGERRGCVIAMLWAACRQRGIRPRRKVYLETGATIKVGDDTTLKLFNLRIKVELSSEQVADDGLSSALLAFRRAANSLAQVEDEDSVQWL